MRKIVLLLAFIFVLGVLKAYFNEPYLARKENKPVCEFGLCPDDFIAYVLARVEKENLLMIRLRWHWRQSVTGKIEIKFATVYYLPLPQMKDRHYE